MNSTRYSENRKIAIAAITHETYFTTTSTPAIKILDVLIIIMAHMYWVKGQHYTGFDM